MLNNGLRFGVVVEVLSRQQKIIINRSLLRASPPHSRPPSLPTRLSFNPVRPILRMGSSFKASHSVSPRQSSTSFNSSCLQQRKGNSRKSHLVNGLLVDSVPTTSTTLKGGASYYAAPLALSSSPHSPSVMLRRSAGVGQEQRQHRVRRNNRRSQQKNRLLVEAIASTDDPATDLRQSNSLYEELQRYGVHESDYTPPKVKPRQPNLSQDMKEHKTTGRESIPRRRKASADLTSGSEQDQHPPSKENPDVVQAYCEDKGHLKLEKGLLQLVEEAAREGSDCGLHKKVDFTHNSSSEEGLNWRLRQHNGEIAGGAKSARAGRPWRLVCTVQGFNTRSEACRFEWKWKSTAAKIKTIIQEESETMESPLVTRRKATLAKVLKSEDWNKLNVQWHDD